MVTDPSDTKTNRELISEKLKVNGKECVQNCKVGYKIFFFTILPFKYSDSLIH